MKTVTEAKTMFVLLGSTPKALRHGALPPGVGVCRGRTELESAIAAHPGAWYGCRSHARPPTGCWKARSKPVAIWAGPA